MCVPMLSVYNFVRMLFFMVSGGKCGNNIFNDWGNKKQNNKFKLIRIAIPILIWASIMFSVFIFSQILMVKGITSPQIMPPDMFKEALQYYFMKYNIKILQ